MIAPRWACSNQLLSKFPLPLAYALAVVTYCHAMHMSRKRLCSTSARATPGDRTQTQPQAACNTLCTSSDRPPPRTTSTYSPPPNPDADRISPTGPEHPDPASTSPACARSAPLPSAPESASNESRASSVRTGCPMRCAGVQAPDTRPDAFQIELPRGVRGLYRCRPR
ncbi:hypothetical protein DENSPDRAFT_287896 [Dentipellis sp. KUC8613]|nr:hypothetical protein DENSPDRAFT_287896 [Dentipellis sp. KUC8613]